MQISSRFTIANHILIIIALETEHKVTSDYLAGSVGVNPVIIRKTLSQLRNAELITVARGTGGASLAKEAKEITLLDVYRAVESISKDGQLFAFHEHPNPDCNIGRNIHRVLDDKLESAQKALEADLEKTTLADVVQEAERYQAK